MLGKNYLNMLTSVYFLAHLLHQRNHYRDAEVFYHQACTGYRKTLGENHPTAIACSRNYSSMLQQERASPTTMVALADRGRGEKWLRIVVFFNIITMAVHKLKSSVLKHILAFDLNFRYLM